MKHITPEQIRDASLPKSLRGFDETATRELLADVAATVKQLTSERDELRRQLDETSSPSADSVDPLAIGNALLTAQRAGEALVAEAQEAAARIAADAQEKADGLVEQARRTAAEIEQQHGERRAELEREHDRLRDELGGLQASVDAERRMALARVQAEADEQAARVQERLNALNLEEATLRQFIDDRRRRFVEMLESTLGEVDRLQDVVLAEDGEGELPDLLNSRAGAARDQAEADPPDA